MPDSALSRIERDLRRAGVAHRYARRAALELREHCQDIEADALARGCPPDAAAREALRRIGQVEDIVAAAAARRELRSLLARLAPAAASLHAWRLRHTPSPAARGSWLRWSVAAGGGATATLTLLAAMQISLSLG